jgi:alpha-ribazole phosphatase
MERLNRLYLVRHGQVVGHEGFHANGHTDVDITDVGLEQMEFLAQRLRLASIGAIYSSDLKRAKKGALIIARHHNVSCKQLKELRELYFGEWEGLSFLTVQETFPEELEKRKLDIAHFRAPGGGESMLDLSERILPCLKKILEENKGKNVLVVAHGAVNRIILCDALGLDLNNTLNIQQDYGCLNIIDYFQDHTLIRLVNG